MISILIPTYNCGVLDLVRELEKQAEVLSTPYEIRVYDDASAQCPEENEQLKAIPNVVFKKLEHNLGRTAIRNKLAEEAVYETLLFMDADVMPKHPDFLKQFIAEAGEADVVFGGISYSEEKPPQDQSLRWKYGRCREAKTVEERRKIPYLSIISQCFLIRKEVFLKVNTYHENLYGLDVLFSTNLKNLNARVKHIENPIVHLGLESNDSFVKKTEAGIDTLHRLTREGLVEESFRPLQKAYLRLKRWGLRSFFCWLLKLNRKGLIRRSVSKNPSLFCFDLYRLHYYCRLEKMANRSYTP